MQKTIAGVAGSGAMGSGIAQVAALAGCKVFLYDTSNEALQKAKSAIESSLQKLVEKNKISAAVSGAAIKNINTIQSVEGFSECDIIIEAIVEDVVIKQRLFSEIEKQVSGSCILASNTSSLSITSIASACINPGRMLGIHFFNPASIMPLVEIIPGIRTSESAFNSAKSIIESWSKTTVKAKDTPGFIVNRIARPFYGEAIRIYEEQLASVVTIDKAMKNTGKFKMGPFELMDLIGNDINYTVTETVWKQMFFDDRYKPSQTQKRMVEANLLGRKTNGGYYDYQTGVTVAREPEHGKEEYIFNRIIAMLINEAVDALYLGIAGRDDIDMAMMKGVNYPMGLLKWCDVIGAEHILNTLEQLHNSYLEQRYRPSVLLRKMADEKKKFY